MFYILLKVELIDDCAYNHACMREACVCVCVFVCVCVRECARMCVLVHVTCVLVTVM